MLHVNSLQGVFIGTSFIGTTGQPDIRPSEGGRDGAQPSPGAVAPYTIYTFYTAEHPEYDRSYGHRQPMGQTMTLSGRL